MGFYLKLFITEHIGTTVYANGFIDLLEKYGFQLKKIGYHEPIKYPYSKEKAVEFWTKEEDGCYNFETGQLEGKAGGMMGKGEGFWFQTYWWKHPNQVSINFTTIYFTKKLFKQMQYSNFIMLFKDLISCFNPVVGYISDEVSVKRQHFTGNIMNRISGVFWCNYYNTNFSQYLNKENKLFNFPWYDIEELDVGGTFTRLTEIPDDKLIEQKEIVAQEYFGKEKFNGKALDFPVLS